MAQKDLVNRKQMTLTLDKNVIEYLKEHSAKTNVPISRYIDMLVLQDKEKNNQRDKSTSD